MNERDTNVFTMIKDFSQLSLYVTYVKMLNIFYFNAVVSTQNRIYFMLKRAQSWEVNPSDTWL